MPALIYIHGFLSSPQSLKAQLTKQYLSQHHPEIIFEAPALTAYPEKTRLQIDELVQTHRTDEVYLMGSSMGGFWATYFGEKYNLPAILINPACEPHKSIPTYVNRPMRNYHTREKYLLKPHHVDEMAAVVIDNVQRSDNYWLLVQTGDETLDYRLAVAKYQNCKQTVEQGGDHGFVDFERHLPECIEFLQAFYRHKPTI